MDFSSQKTSGHSFSDIAQQCCTWTLGKPTSVHWTRLEGQRQGPCDVLTIYPSFRAKWQTGLYMRCLLLLSVLKNFSSLFISNQLKLVNCYLLVHMLCLERSVRFCVSIPSLSLSPSPFSLFSRQIVFQTYFSCIVNIVDLYNLRACVCLKACLHVSLQRHLHFNSSKYISLNM